MASKPLAKAKPLHLATDMEHLNSQCCPENVISHINSSSAKLLVTSAAKVLKIGEDNLALGDEEVAYVHCMRFVEIMKGVYQKGDYKNDKKYFNGLMNPAKVKEVLAKCEKISGDLIKRYELRKEVERLDSELKSTELSEAQAENEKRKGGVVKPGKNGVIAKEVMPKEEAKHLGGISCLELKNYLEQLTKRFLIIDCRFASDYKSSHLNHPNCVSIPAEKLARGSTANSIQAELIKSPDYIEANLSWQKRADYDLIILYDWNSSFENYDTSKPIYVLYDAITKWDPATKYKGKLHILQGGIRHLFYAYPQLLTNPVAVQENVSCARVDPSKTLQSISYPSLEDNSPKKLPFPSTTIPGTHTYSPKTQIPSLNNNFSNGRIDTVEVDRSNKPVKKIQNPSVANKHLNGFSSMNGTTTTTDTREKIHTENKKSDEIGENLCLAVDQYITVVEKVASSEDKIGKLLLAFRGTADQATREMLLEQAKSESKILESLERALDSATLVFEKLQLEYFATVKSESEKSTLPRIRQHPVQIKFDEKLIKKSDADKILQRYRDERMRQEEDYTRLLEEEQTQVKQSHLNGDISRNATTNGVSIHNNLGPSGEESNFPDSEDESLGGASFPSSLKATSSTSASRPTAPKPNYAGGRPPNESAPIPITTARLRDEDAPRNSLLKRSHSNPNFAQSLPDDEVNPPVDSSRHPEFNRDKKPQPAAAKRREFNSIASSGSGSGSGLYPQRRTGLKNLGNTCYMNSIMQCLNHTHHLTDYILRQSKAKDGRYGRNIIRGEISEEVAAAITEMNLGHRSIALNDLKSVILKRRPTFRPHEQQDSHEFLTVLLQSMHEEAVDKNLALNDKLPNIENLPIGEAAEISWNHYKRTEGTIIQKLFGGQYMSTVKCGNCNHESVTFESFFVLTVPIPANSNSPKKRSINECLDLSCKPEEINGFKCVKCKVQGKASKTLDVWRLPPYLIIHLQRFYNDGYWKKRMGEVEFPVEQCLGVNSKSKEGRYHEKNQLSSYQLYGVSNHYGTMEGGHYTAYCTRGPTNSWYKYDDQEVTECNHRDVMTPAAYILFFRNVELD